MSWLTPILADDAGLAHDIMNQGAGFRAGATSQFMILFTATVGVAVIAGVFCLIFFRKRPRKHSHRPRHNKRVVEPASKSGDEGTGSGEDGSQRRRKRRMRRPHRPRNPTLAETGGLPPIREGPPPAP